MQEGPTRQPALLLHEVGWKLGDTHDMDRVLYASTSLLHDYLAVITLAQSSENGLRGVWCWTLIRRQIP